MGFLSRIGGLVVRAIRFVVAWLTEGDIRRRKQRIRTVKQGMVKARSEYASLGRAIQNEKNRREYLRRGVLITYFKAQREIIDIALEALEDAKSNVYEKLKRIQSNLTEGNRKYISPPVWNEYRQLHDKLHLTIAESKSITTALRVERVKVEAERRRLTNPKTHKKLGAKIEIQRLLADKQKDARKRFAALAARDSELDLGQLIFVLARKCPGCRTHVAPEMNYCHDCGRELLEVHVRRKFTREQEHELPNVQPCSYCGAPLDELFDHCYNCGEEHDPYELKEQG